MAHELAKSSAAIRRPVTVSARYACQCANREVLTINVVLDLNLPEWAFIEAMRQLRQDIIKEVNQHVEPDPRFPDIPAPQHLCNPHCPMPAELDKFFKRQP